MRQQSAEIATAEQKAAPIEPVELSNEDVRHVAGGINPQPLPPRSDPHAW
jgi:hypothetical protein